MPRFTLLLVGSLVALGGCVPPPPNDPYAPPPPTYNNPPPAPQPVGPRRIEGLWGWVDGRGRQRVIGIERVRRGLLARGQGGGESVYYQRIGRGIFEDERGRTYEFINDYEAVFRRPNGRSFPMRRL